MIALNPRKYVPDFPLDLDAVISRSLEKNRDVRYQWASEMQRELEKYIYTRQQPASDRAAMPASARVVDEGRWQSYRFMPGTVSQGTAAEGQRPAATPRDTCELRFRPSLTLSPQRIWRRRRCCVAYPR